MGRGSDEEMPLTPLEKTVQQSLIGNGGRQNLLSGKHF